MAQIFFSCSGPSIKHEQEVVSKILTSVQNNQDLEQEFSISNGNSSENNLNLDHLGAKPILGTIKVVVNEDVQKWIDYFQDSEKERFTRYLERSQKYKKLIESILIAEGIPKELFFLGLIESGFKISARSHANAVGIWQFIRPTAMRYGLKVNYYVDERNDPILSTFAAARYLKDLYNAFQSWELAMAAYNCGEGRVLSAIMAGDSRSFWKLQELKKLPPETRSYIPKIMAAIEIGKNPSDYGIELDPDYEEFPMLQLAKVPAPLHLKDLASSIGISFEKLKSYNPQFRKDIIFSHSDYAKIWLPERDLIKVGQNQKLLSSRRMKLGREKKQSVVQKYRVKRGDSLFTIAQRFKMSVFKLKRSNHLKSNRIRPGQNLNIYQEDEKDKNIFYYIVRRGDSLHRIANMFEMNLRAIKRLNGINGTFIRRGQKLKISYSGHHQVKRGDTLSEIARKYKTSISFIQNLNFLKEDHLIIGQILRI